MCGEAPAEAPAEPAGPATEVLEDGDAKEESWQCYGCCRSFSSGAELRAHVLEAGERCSGPAWQAAVNAISCMPGAGTVLWCPACPDELLGKWTGSASKASALLRHVVSSSKASRAHAWFLEGFIDLLLCSPPPPPLLPDAAESGEDAQEPPDVQEERLQAWILSSPPLMSLVGPLLARPGPAAREAARQEMVQFKLHCTAAPFPFSGPGDAGSAVPEAAKNKKKKSKKADEAPAPGYDLYNEAIPMDVFLNCEDHTQRTAEGVPVLDLLDSDDDEAALTEL